MKRTWCSTTPAFPRTCGFSSSSATPVACCASSATSPGSACRSSAPASAAHRPPPADPAPYVRELGLCPAFGQADNRVVFERRFLDLPLPGANPEVARACEEQCRALLARRQVRGGLAGRIRDRLLRTPGHLPDMQTLAMELHLTVRTLRRRLDDEGSSYRLLLDEVRQALAEELLATGAIRLEEIAERLGYGEVSNFIHAFRRWKGMTPRQYRQRRRLDAMS